MAYNGQDATVLVAPPRPNNADGGRTAVPTFKPIPESFLARSNDFWSRVDMPDIDACWLWRGYVNREGYGRLGDFYVHRIAFVLNGGVIPDGHTIDHVCRNRLCVNPAHLEPVSVSENVRRGLAVPGTSAPAGFKRKRSSARYQRRRARGLCISCNMQSETFRCERCRASHNARNYSRPR